MTIQASNPGIAAALKQHSGVLLAEGIILIILGALAIIAPMIASLAFTIVLGWLFLIGGIVGLVTTFWVRGTPGFWWSLISAVITIVVGALLVGWPVEGVLSLTFILIAFFVLEGIATIMFAVEHRREMSGRWGWMLASGIVTLILAAMIFAGLPATATWAIGLLIGIDLVFGGAALTAIAMAARRG